MMGRFEQLCDFVENAEIKAKGCRIEVESSLNFIKLLTNFHTTFPLFSKIWVVSKPFEQIIKLLFDSVA